MVYYKSIAELALEHAHETRHSTATETATAAARKVATKKGIITVRNGHYNVVIRTVIA